MRLAALLLAISACATRIAPSAHATPADDVAALTRTGDLKTAFARAQKWTESEPDSVPALTTWGQLALRCGAYDTARDCFESALFLEPTPATAIGLADALRELGNGDAARQAYRHALELDASALEAQVGIVRSFLDDPQRRMEARLSLDVLASIASDDAGVNLARAELDVAEGDPAGAIKRLRTVVEAAADYTPALFLLGKLLYRYGDPTGGRSHWARFVALEPEAPDAWLLRHGLCPFTERALAVRGSYLSLSPDGKLVAYVGVGEIAREQVFVAGIDGTPGTAVVLQVEGYPSGISWSPDSTRLACRSYRKIEHDGKTEWEYSLWTAGVDGSERRRIYAGQSIGVPAWLPDGKQLCVDGYVARRGRALYSVEDREGAELKDFMPQAKGTSLQSVSCWAGGAKIATTRVAYVPQAIWQIASHASPSDAQGTVVAESDAPLYYPQFTHDGASLVYIARTPQSLHEVRATAADGSRSWPVRLLRTPTYGAPVSLGPGDRSLLVQTTAGPLLVSLTGLGD